MKHTILLLILLISCSPKEDKEQLFQIRTFAPKDITLADSIDYQFIPLETKDECLIGLAGDVQIINNKIFILEGKKNENLFVFDMNGRFITNVGHKGNGPGGYNRIFSFDIDVEDRSIIISDKYVNKLLFYDLDSFRFKYAIETPFYYNAFSHLQHGNKIFMGYKGFENPNNTNGKDSYYVCITDSLLNPETALYKASFTTSYSLTGGKSNLYTYDGDIHIYHHLFPYVYRVKNNTLVPVYEIKLDDYPFPPIHFLEKIAGTDTDYTGILTKSEYITNYRIDECSTMINLSFQKNNQMYYAIYNKKAEKGYIFNLAEYFSTMGLGVWLKPRSANDEYIIGELNFDENSSKYVTKNKQLKELVTNRSAEDNPVICLYKWKH